MKKNIFYFGLLGITNAGKTSILNNIFTKRHLLLERIRTEVFNSQKNYSEVESLFNFSFEKKDLVSKILELQLSASDKQVLMNKYYKSFDELSLGNYINISDQSIGSTIAYNYINKDTNLMTKLELDNFYKFFSRDVNEYINEFKDIFANHNVFLNIYRINVDKKQTLKETREEEEIYFGSLDLLESLDFSLKLLSETLKDNNIFKSVVVKDYYIGFNEIDTIADQIINSIINSLKSHLH